MPCPLLLLTQEQQKGTREYCLRMQCHWTSAVCLRPHCLSAVDRFTSQMWSKRLLGTVQSHSSQQFLQLCYQIHWVIDIATLFLGKQPLTAAVQITAIPLL
ncbi:hypothetical protein MTO96_029956 [Rhipicephalus appendiculatus]